VHDENKRRKVDDTWYPVTLDEVKAYVLCIFDGSSKKIKYSTVLDYKSSSRNANIKKNNAF